MAEFQLRKPRLSKGSSMPSLPTRLREIAGVVPASRLERPAPVMVSSGVTEIDQLTGGLPRGGFTEICGPASSGRTSLMIAALAAATARNELCALIDVGDCFDPKSAEAAGVSLAKLLWARCGSSTVPSPELSNRVQVDSETCAGIKHALQAKQKSGTIMPPAKVWYGRPPARSERTSRNAPHRNHVQQKQKTKRSTEVALLANRWRDAAQQALKVTDLILQSGGFGVVALDMGDVPAEILRRVSLTSWFRFRRAVENTPTALLVIGREPFAGTCASVVLRTSNHLSAISNNGRPSHAQVFAGIEGIVEVVRSRAEESYTTKKPPRSMKTEFASRTEWVG